MAPSSPANGVPGGRNRLVIPPPPSPFDRPQADQRDVDVAVAFGVRHPEVFAGVWVDGPRIHVGLTELEPYADELRALMAGPDDVQIDLAKYTAAELSTIQQQIIERVRGIPGVFQGIGIQHQKLALQLSAAGAAVARELHEEFGELLSVHVGHRAYPPDGLDVPAPPAPVATRSFPGLVIIAQLDKDRIRSGAGWSGEVELRNDGPALIDFETDQPVIGSVIDASGRVVGAFSGVIAGTGIRVNLPPGTSQKIRFLGGTGGGTGERYSTPPGDFSAVVVIPVHDDESGGQLVSTPTDLRVS
jgi:hypothetical protein